MRLHDSSDASGDELLDAEIARALAVEPSPTFVANVRARVAALPSPGKSGGTRTWMLIPALATAAAGVVLLWYEPPANVNPPSVVARQPDIAPLDGAPASPRTVTAAVDDPLPRDRAPRQRERELATATDVVVAPEESYALRALFEIARRGNLPEPVPLETPDGEGETALTEAAPPDEVVIEPILIAPLDEGAEREGDVE